MEQDIKDIELFIDFCRAPYNFEHEVDEKNYLELSNKIERLIKAYKKLEEENKKLKQLKEKHNVRINDLCSLVDNFEYNSIPVSLVEETKKELVDNYIDSDGDQFIKLEHQLEILDKLLEKRKI